jgi:hypothetical protein
LIPNDASVVHQNVYASKLVACPFDHRIDLGDIRNIGLDGYGSSASSTNFIDYRVRVVSTSHRNNRRTGRSKSHRDTTTDPARRTSNDYDTVLQTRSYCAAHHPHLTAEGRTRP